MFSFRRDMFASSVPTLTARASLLRARIATRLPASAVIIRIAPRMPVWVKAPAFQSAGNWR